jgi:hypothetical protein
MEIAEVIKEWLDGFDSIIDSAAVEPALVKQDGFLRRAFELAFPPEDLSHKISFKSEGEAVALEPMIQAHRPYYRSKTIQRETTNPKTGVVKVTSRLELSLKDSAHVVLALKENGLVRSDAEVVTKALAVAKSRKRRSEYSKSVELLLRIRQLQAAELAQVEAYLREAQKRGDSQTVKYYENEHGRVVQDIERSHRLGADL